MAVGLGARHLLAADIAAGARDILHHHGLAELGRQPLGHEAGDDVGTGARRERHDELDRLVGPGEGGPEGQGRGREAGGEGQELAAAHGALKQPAGYPSIQLMRDLLMNRLVL